MFFVVFFLLAGIGIPLFSKFIVEMNPFLKGREEDLNSFGMEVMKNTAEFFGLPMKVKNTFYQLSKDFFLFPLSGFFLFAAQKDLYSLVIGILVFPLWFSAGILLHVVGTIYHLLRDVFFIFCITYEFLEKRKMYQGAPGMHYLKKTYIYSLKFIFKEILTLEFIFSRENPGTQALQKYIEDTVLEARDIEEIEEFRQHQVKAKYVVRKETFKFLEDIANRIGVDNVKTLEQEIRQKPEAIDLIKESPDVKRFCYSQGGDWKLLYDNLIGGSDES